MQVKIFFELYSLFLIHVAYRWRIMISVRHFLHSSYCYGKRTWITTFKSWTRLFAFHIMLILLGKSINYFSFSYEQIVRQTGLFKLDMATGTREEKLWTQTKTGEGWAPPKTHYMNSIATIKPGYGNSKRASINISKSQKLILGVHKSFTKNWFQLCVFRL